MKNNPNFDLFKQLAKEVLGDNTSGKSVKQKLADVAAKTGETLLKETKKQIPTQRIEDSLGKLYSLVGSREIADMISQATQVGSPEELAVKLESIKEKISDPKVAAQIAETVKAIAKDEDSIAQFTGLLEGVAEKLNPQQQAVAQMVIAQAEGFLQMATMMEKEDIAYMIQESVASISTDFLAEQLSANLQQIDPEAFSAAANEALKKLPAPKTVSKLIDSAFDAAAKQVGQVAKGQKPSMDGFKQDLANGARKTTKRVNKKPGFKG